MNTKLSGIYKFLTPRSYWLCLILFFISSSISESQQTSYIFKNYSVVDGLPENTGTSLLQSSDGYIWIGTQGGLARADGYGLESFLPDPDDSTSISNASIFTLFEDKRGRLWIGTSNGLNQYEPWSQSFRRYLHDPSSLAAAYISVIKDDSKGNIWSVKVMPDNTLELWRIDPVKGSQERFVHDLAQNNSISASGVYLSRDSHSPLLVDSSDNVWLGTLGGGLNRYDPATGGFVHYRHDPENPTSIGSDNVYALYEAKGDPGHIWVMSINSQTGNGIVQRLDVSTGNFQTISDPSRGNFLSFSYFEDGIGNLWLGDNLALHKYRFEDQTLVTYRVPPEISIGQAAVIWDICPDFNQQLWLRTEYSMQMLTFDMESGSFRSVNMNTDRPENVVTFDMISDHAGLIWIGSWGFGVYSLNPTQSIFQHVQLRDPISEQYNRVMAFSQDVDGSVWIGTHIDGLTVYNPKTRAWTKANLPGLSNTTITAMRSAGAGRVWVGSRDAAGLSRVDLVDLPNRRIIPASPTVTAALTNISGIVRKIYTDSKGDTWIAIDGGGIIRLLGDGSVKKYVYDPENPDQYPDNENRPFSFFEHQGTLWVGTNNILLTYNRERDTFSVLPGNWLATTQMIPSSKGGLWVASYLNGLTHLDLSDSSQTVYGDVEGLANTSIFDMSRDNVGNIWIRTARGLTYFPEDSVRFTNFGTSSGIRPGTRGLILPLSDGTMITSGLEGFYVFDPSTIKVNPSPPKIVLSGLRVFNKNVWPGQPEDELPSYNGEMLQFSHNQNMVSIDFTGLFFSNSDEIYYSLKLQGFDDSWSIPSTYRSTTFTNLAPGTYHLMVRASNPDKVWSDEIVVVSFEILPPWWRTWWAYGAYLLMFIGSVVVIDRYQRKRLIKQEEERNRERELEHAREIEKAYNNLEVAHQNLKSAQKQLIEQEKLASLGQLTAGIAHEIKNPLNFVNNFSAVSIEMVDEVVVDLEKYMEDSPDRAFIKETLDFIKANLTKINEHGTRADGIVKSMLMHSRGGSGKMEPTNLNDLVKEYVNLAFHGMRAGKNAISVELDLKLDDSIGEIPMIAEDFSRVILNLTNNAFDAMREKLSKGTEGGYKPALKVVTKKDDKLYTIEVSDNGPGIPDNIRDKILQPFFTTKKGTEGTGLGLSITHDIVKAHGGFIEIDSTEAGATFRIIINPVT
jgi:signal transduction histidine kinase/ligand-binding sensor domain-containing protein